MNSVYLTAISFGLILFLSWYVFSPILFPQRPDAESDRLEHPVTNEEQLYLLLEDLENDFRGGKIPPEEYSSRREDYVRQLALVLPNETKNLTGERG